MPDVGIIHLNPGIFAFTYLLTTPVTRKLGVLPLPFGDGKNAPVLERDIARCAAVLLDDPNQYFGTSWRPTGPELLSGSDVAGILSNVFGRRVKYQNISFRMFSKAARAMGFSDFDSYNLRHYAEEIRSGAFAIGAPTNHVETLTGSPPENFAVTAERYAADATRLAPNVRDRSLLGSVGFLIKMLATPAPNFRSELSFEGPAHLAAPLLGHQNAQWQAAAADGRLLLQPGPDEPRT
ncbi:NmrA family NAD(P)-binding protein [Ruegeria sp. EL01]|jgi:hypothetical protein|uniref:NmrA family NAD(P)-binding protein n=1 Tax=Ruegeria sp. EL01 TaxID=2107578 RepID=UPI000EA81D77|nr:NmrA family NAD(P)-binding protein [Ruegeria sp. EL01]